MVWQCVSHNLMSYLCIFISRSIEFCWFWFLAWWLYLTCCMHIKISRIVWVISVLIWNFDSCWPIVCTFCLPCLLLSESWPCSMLLTWSFLGHVLICLKLLLVKYWLLFWLFALPLTLALVLVVCTHFLSFVFQVQASNPNDWCNLTSWDANYFVH